MKKITGTQLAIGGILLYLILRARANRNAVTAPVKPATKPATQNYTAAPRTSSQKPADALAGAWEINCYHQVI